MSQKTSRRDLLKRTLIVLGAAALVQPSGGVLGFAQGPPKKEDAPKKDGGKLSSPTTTQTKGKKGSGKGRKGKGRKKPPKAPKKDG